MLREVAELLLRILLIGYLYGITSERKLVEELRMHLAWRRLCESRRLYSRQRKAGSTLGRDPGEKDESGNSCITLDAGDWCSTVAIKPEPAVAESFPPASLATVPLPFCSTCSEAPKAIA